MGVCFRAIRAAKVCKTRDIGTTLDHSGSAALGRLPPIAPHKPMGHKLRSGTRRINLIAAIATQPRAQDKAAEGYTLGSWLPSTLGRQLSLQSLTGALRQPEQKPLTKTRPTGHLKIDRSAPSIFYRIFGGHLFQRCPEERLALVVHGAAVGPNTDCVRLPQRFTECLRSVVLRPICIIQAAFGFDLIPAILTKMNMRQHPRCGGSYNVCG